MCAPSVTDFREAGKNICRNAEGGGKAMGLGKDESGIWRIAQLLFWSREGNVSLSNIKQLSSEYTFMDSSLGRAGSLAVPSCLGLSECCR